MKYLLLISILFFLPIVYSFGDIGIEEGITISPNITFNPSVLNVSKLRFPETPVDIERSIATDKVLKELEEYLEGESYDQIPSEVLEVGESDYTSLNNILNSLETKRKEYYTRNKPAEVKINFEGNTAFLEVEKDVKIQIDFIKENNSTRPKVNIILNPEYSNYVTDKKIPLNLEEETIEENPIVNIINIFVIINIVIFIIILIVTNKEKITNFFSKRS